MAFMRPIADYLSEGMSDIHSCVICGRKLSLARVHVDTCGERCFHSLLRQQRAESGDLLEDDA